jgi:hypothetical protein
LYLALGHAIIDEKNPEEHMGAFFSIVGTRFSEGTHAFFSIERARFSVDMHAFFTVKTTTSLKNPQNIKRDTSTTGDERPTAAQLTGRVTAEERIETVGVCDRFDLSDYLLRQICKPD